MDTPRKVTFVSDAERAVLTSQQPEPGRYLMLLVVGEGGAQVDGTNLVPRMADTIAALLAGIDNSEVDAEGNTIDGRTGKRLRVLAAEVRGKA